MLKLRKVELQGFKSFCDRTELRFNGSGIAAIVGPNGCGKSNLSDAISWVLGEQSARSLRGQRMEDVIFAGTKARKPLGMASVTMVLADPDAASQPAPINLSQPRAEGDTSEAASAAKVQEIAAPPAKPGEITVTRRLFRSGESEYLIDGKQARLRDIQDIFMGSGLGPESYAIIEQGRIGQILSSKPQDRRAVIEEAAGITKYKSRRRLAEARLESSKQNLSRVFDILEEVTRQVNSLKRQASKARRYQELKAELEGLLRTVLAGRFASLSDEAQKASAALEAASAALNDATAQASDKDAERQRTQEVFYELEQQLTEARRQRAEMNVEAERTRGRLESQVREAASIEQRMAAAEQETVALGASLEQNEAERGTFARNAADLEEQMKQLRDELLRRNEARDAAQNRVREAERSIETLRNHVLRLLGEASSVRNQIAQADTYLSGIERERTRVSAEQQNASAEIDRLTLLSEEITARIAERGVELEATRATRRSTEEELTAKRALAVEIGRAVDQLRAEGSSIRARRESLENILSHHSYTTESTRRLLTALEGGRAGDFKPEGVLADFVEVDPAWERAAEEFLHDELEYVVVKDWSQAESSLALLRGELDGRATFLVEGLGGSGQPSAEASVPVSSVPALPRLTDFVRFTNGLSGQTRHLLPRLTGCFLAADAAEARAMSEQHRDAWFLLADGQCYNGRTLTGGTKKSSGPLVLKRELREFAATLEAHDTAMAARLAEQAEVTEAVAALERELEVIRHTQQEAEKQFVSLEHDLRRSGEELQRARSRASVSGQELDRLSREEERTLASKAASETLVAEKDAARASGEQNMEALREQLDSAQAEAHSIAEEHAALRANLAALEERLRGERSALARLESLAREMSSRREQIAAEIQRQGETRSRILAENIELDRRLTALASEIADADRAVLEMEQKEAGYREALAAADQVLRDLRTAIEAGHARRSEAEIELTRKQSELQFLDETSRKELNSPVAELTLPEDFTAEALQVAETSCEETRKKIENLGAVNPAAYEEFEEAQRRHDFLSAQRQDLLDSIRDTEKAIEEIDEYSKNRFTEAFKVINDNFRTAFTTLFGGGIGEMHLTDETNVNESGIDIVASPPGKKLQNVLLLSGGEKALTALSLLMAIFKYQPSPFCILDEVDAPLDEANIGRLTRLLGEMSGETQFIMITHSKKTMEVAQAMYGVTMQEAGVSKLVSVRFHSHEHATNAAA